MVNCERAFRPRSLLPAGVPPVDTGARGLSIEVEVKVRVKFLFSPFDQTYIRPKVDYPKSLRDAFNFNSYIC